MDENKSNSKAIIAIVILVIFVLVGGFVVYRENMMDSSASINSVTELNQEQKELYDSLITATKTYGFYFDKDVTIDNIEADKILGYVLDQYSKENNISFDYNISDDTCDFPSYKSEVYDDNGNGNKVVETKTISMVKVKKEVIDSYIKSKFNTDRVFTLKNDDDLNCSIYNRLIFGTSSYVYTPSDNSYGFGYVSTEGELNRVYTKFLKLEESNTGYVFYDKALVCKDDGLITCGTDEGHTSNLFEIDMENSYDKSLLNDSEELLDINSNYVFEKYDKKLNTYKHTFKKANDGKYYWYSSELVK